ncbi:M48 family metalloprotease [Desulfosarcina cetonica]|uniref:M48 family metalloprotease n=1 Tax=Desulfosarcina cetonica TaxID=90730 RepID=UPI00248C6112|nr:M48 family metalloprotease [Desulfosarcina cetonica]
MDFLIGLLGQQLSRRHEYAADRFAAITTGRAQPLIDALRKLSVHNLSNLYPHPLYVLLNDSHPPVLQRIAALEAIETSRRVV